MEKKESLREALLSTHMLFTAIDSPMSYKIKTECAITIQRLDSGEVPSPEIEQHIRNQLKNYRENFLLAISGY